MSSYSVTAYLILVIVSGTFSVLTGIYLSIKSPRYALATRILLRGCLWIAIASIFLILFRTRIIENTWGVFISVGILLFLNEYVMIGIERIRSKRRVSTDSQVVEQSHEENWGRIRSQGKRRFILLHAIVFGYGALWLGISLKVILLEMFPTYLLIALVVGFIVWGYVTGLREWNRNEHRYLT